MIENTTETLCLRCEKALEEADLGRETCPHCDAKLEIRRDATVRVAPITVFADATL